jgi:hypothetical protein
VWAQMRRMQCCCRQITAHRPKNGQKRSRNARETLEKRSRNALGIGQRSVSMHFTNIDDGVASSQQVGEGASPSLGVPARRAKRQKVTRESK